MAGSTAKSASERSLAQENQKDGFKMIKDTKNRHHRLDDLIESLNNEEYLETFIDMV